MKMKKKVKSVIVTNKTTIFHQRQKSLSTESDKYTWVCPLTLAVSQEKKIEKNYKIL